MISWGWWWCGSLYCSILDGVVGPCLCSWLGYERTEAVILNKNNPPPKITPRDFGSFRNSFMILWSKSRRHSSFQAAGLAGRYKHLTWKRFRCSWSLVAPFKAGRYLKERWGIPPKSCLKIPFPPNSTDYSLLFSTTFLFLSYVPILLVSFWVCWGFFSPSIYCFGLIIFVLFSLYGKMLGKELLFFWQQHWPLPQNP